MKLLTAILLTALAVGACSDGDDGAAPTSGPGTDGPVLAGTEWHLVSMDVGGELTEFSGAQVPTLRFEADRLSMTDGVNRGSGSYTLDGTAFSVGPVAATLIGYPEPPRPEFELFRLMDAASAAEITDGRLVITSGDATLVYAAGPPEANPVELENTTWRLTDLSRRTASATESLNATLGPVPAVVTFGEGTVEAYDGVNTATGTFRAEGAEVAIELDEVTDLPVVGEPLPQHELFGLLRDVTGAEVADDGTLTLLVGDRASLRFERVVGGTDGG
jgi:heat shock protein HslJ